MELNQLYITPIMKQGKYLALVNDDMHVLLPHARFELLIKAICCLVTKPQGCFMAQDLGVEKSNLYKLVERLRNDFCRVLGAEARNSFVINPGSGRYKVSLERGQVVVDPRLQELVPHDLASRDVELLLRHYTSRPYEVDVVSARTFYDSNRSHSRDVHPAPRTKDDVMKPSILATDSFANKLRFFDDVHRYAAERCSVPVVTDAAHLDATGVATVVVSNGECLFTRVFKFCYCSPLEFQEHAIEFAIARRDVLSGNHPASSSPTDF